MGLVTIVRVFDTEVKKPKKVEVKPPKKLPEKPAKKSVTEEIKKTIDEKFKKTKVKEIRPIHKLQHDNDYERHTQLYKESMKSYDKPSLPKASYSYITQEKNERNFDWGKEVMNYKERREYVRKVQMNALMGGRHNHVNPDEERNYKFWKWARKENYQMSFQMHDGVFNT